MLNTTKHYFSSSLYVAGAGLLLAYIIGGAHAVWITFVLSVLEVSLSFDNAIVNAQVLKNMDDVWRRRFLTWGMLIAVVGMRLLFPTTIAAFATSLGPIDALMLAISEPEEYKTAITSVHSSVMGFGQAFLMMVALKFFIDNDKEIHWLHDIEHRLTILGKIEAIQAAVALIVTYIMYLIIDKLHGTVDAHSYLSASVVGLILYIIVDGLEAFTGVEEGELTGATVKSGLAGFLYLEVLDSSFSFDGVLGAFALSNNMFVIAIGLGIGAMFVRSLTILMVDKGTVDQYRYLEHGAFYAIFALAVIMNLNTVLEISETITGLIGAAFIAASIISSISYKHKYVSA